MRMSASMCLILMEMTGITGCTSCMMHCDVDTPTVAQQFALRVRSCCTGTASWLESAADSMMIMISQDSAFKLD